MYRGQRRTYPAPRQQRRILVALLVPMVLSASAPLAFSQEVRRSASAAAEWRGQTPVARSVQAETEWRAGDERRTASPITFGIETSRTGAVALEHAAHLARSSRPAIAVVNEVDRSPRAPLAWERLEFARRASASVTWTRLFALSETSGVAHLREIILPLTTSMRHSRVILASSPPFLPVIHTRTIRRPLPAITHSRMIIPEAVLLQAGLTSSGVAQGGSSTTIILAATASPTTGAYVGMWVTQGGESALVTAYDGPTQTATVTPTWTTAPGSGTSYAVAITKPGMSKVLRPTITVTEA